MSVRVERTQAGQRWGITRLGNGGGLFLSPGVHDPLCGWDWLLDREHPQVDFTMDIRAHGCHFFATVNPDAHKGRIVQEISRVALSTKV